MKIIIVVALPQNSKAGRRRPKRRRGFSCHQLWFRQQEGKQNAGKEPRRWYRLSCHCIRHFLSFPPTRPLQSCLTTVALSVVTNVDMAVARITGDKIHQNRKCSGYPRGSLVRTSRCAQKHEIEDLRGVPLGKVASNSILKFSVTNWNQYVCIIPHSRIYSAL